MQLAKVKLEQLVQHGDILDRYGARIQVLGQRNLIRPDVLEYVDRAVEITKKNDKCVDGREDGGCCLGCHANKSPGPC